MTTKQIIERADRVIEARKKSTAPKRVMQATYSGYGDSVEPIGIGFTIEKGRLERIMGFESCRESDAEFIATAFNESLWLAESLKVAVEALNRIDADFGTDACDGNTMIAREALEKIAKERK